MTSSRPVNRHHLYPRHLWGTNMEGNIKVMEIVKHQALHRLTDINWKATAPREQLQIILDIMTTCLTDEVKNDINKILEIEDPEYFYKNWIYRPR